MFLRLLSLVLSLFFTFGSTVDALPVPAVFYTVVEEPIESLVGLSVIPFPELELPPDS